MKSSCVRVYVDLKCNFFSVGSAISSELRLAGGKKLFSRFLNLFGYISTKRELSKKRIVLGSTQSDTSHLDFLKSQ